MSIKLKVKSLLSSRNSYSNYECTGPKWYLIGLLPVLFAIILTFSLESHCTKTFKEGNISSSGICSYQHSQMSTSK